MPKNNVQNQKSVQEVSKQDSPKSRLSPTHVDFWKARIFQPCYTRKGERHAVTNYSVKIQFGNRRDVFQLNTANRAEAAATARDIWRSLQGQGWDETIRKFKPKAGMQVVVATTFEEFLNQIKVRCLLDPKTLANYAMKLRLLVRQACEINPVSTRYNTRKGEREEWRKEIEVTPMSALTLDRINKWKAARLSPVADNPKELQSRRISINAILRSLNSLFTDERLAQMPEIKVPYPLPWKGITLEKISARRLRYRSKVNPTQLLADAEAELRPTAPEQYKIFLLALFAGLRRNEIDKLLWSSILWKENVIRIEEHACFRPKTDSSLDDVGIAPQLLTYLEETYKKRTGIFVVEATTGPRAGVTYDHYRCHRDLGSLCAWLKTKGLPNERALHTLRKECGRLITEQFGIFAASRVLRHSGIQITAAIYADDKRQILVQIPTTAKPQLN